MRKTTSTQVREVTPGTPPTQGWYVSICLNSSCVIEQEIIIYAGQDEEKTRQFFQDYTCSEGVMNTLTDIVQVVLRNGPKLESYAIK